MTKTINLTNNNKYSFKNIRNSQKTNIVPNEIVILFSNQISNEHLKKNFLKK